MQFVYFKGIYVYWSVHRKNYSELINIYSYYSYFVEWGYGGGL